MKTNKVILVCLIGICFTLISCYGTKKWIPLKENESLSYLRNCLTDSSKNELLNDVLIPDEEAAINVAEAYLFKIYGRNKIEGERPYRIRLVNRYWVIVGSLPKYYVKGGVFEIIIHSKNGAIESISHDK